MTAVKSYEHWIICYIMWPWTDVCNFFSHLSSSPVMSDALERIFTQDSFKRDCTIFPSVTLNYWLFNGCVNLLQRVKETVNGEKQNRHVCKCQFQQLLVYFLSKTRCLLLTIEVRAIDVDMNHIHHIACKIK